MRRVIPLAIGVALVLALVQPIVLVAEIPEGGASELLQALLRRDGSAPVLYPGGLPESLEIDLPQAGRLVGSAEWPDYTRVIIGFEASGSEARTLMTESLVAQGWVPPPAVQRHGFVDSRETHSASLCRENREALHFSVESVGSETLAMLAYLKRFGHSPCVAGRHADFMEREADVFPALVSPAGARSRSSGGGGHGLMNNLGDSRYQSAVLESDLSVPELLEHYGEQMGEAGWSLVEHLVGAESSVQVWVRSGEEGEELLGTLSVVELSDGSAEVSLKVTLRRARKDA